MFFWQNLHCYYLEPDICVNAGGPTGLTIITKSCWEYGILDDLGANNPTYTPHDSRRDSRHDEESKGVKVA